MKFFTTALTAFAALFLTNCAFAATHYVSLDSANPVAPFSDWSTAATNIQDAIDASTNGDLVLVTNGVYSTGGITMDGFLTNRVTLNKALTVQSVNGPFATTIQGQLSPSAPTRCAWLTNNASLIGFTLQFGRAKAIGSGDTSLQSSQGGGVWGSSSNNSMVANCIIASNTASASGGGAYQVSLWNCLISSNSCGNYGSGAYAVTLNNCTVISNQSALSGFGVPVLQNAQATNCIIQFNNTGFLGQLGNNLVLSYCCTTPLPPGQGNFINDPGLFTDEVHLYQGSPCIDAGTNTATGTDLFGEPWANPPSIGCAEWEPDPITATPTMSFTTDPVGFEISVPVAAGPPFACWWTKDGIALSDNGHFYGTQTTNLLAAWVNFSDQGNYQLFVSNAFGMVTSAVVATPTIHCVDQSNANPVPPYLTWSTAATNIQDAITAAEPGEIVLVTNGVYLTGGISVDGQITNRVSITKPILVQSVNGVTNTIIEGTLDPVNTNGPLAVRCAWLTNNSILGGFTLHNGATVDGIPASGGSAGSGGGVAGSGARGPITGSLPTNSDVCNCLIEGNYAYGSGGGAYLVTLNHCTLLGNQVVGSGTFGAGGGAENCNVINCFVISNSANSGKGGGADSCYLRNCAMMGNLANLGSAAYGGSMTNCTISSNISLAFGSGEAVYQARIVNCIIFGNSAFGPMGPNYASSPAMSYTCTTPAAIGPGNIATNPLWLADGLHLSSNSPCIGAGNHSAASGTDIFGHPWNNPPSMGCDEYVPEPPVVAQPTVEPFSGGQQIALNVNPIADPPLSYIWIVNGMPIQDNAHYTNSSTASLFVNNVSLADSGSYQVIVSNAYGATTSQVFQLNIHAVNSNGTNAVSPYLTWDTAATNIQDAIDSAAAGDIVLVTNGVYDTGGKSMDGALTNRVTLDKAVTVLSVNGYSVTTIQGAWDPQSMTGPLSVRCAWMTNGAVLKGFTLANGSTLSGGVGGGAFCSSSNAIVSNCLLTNNVAGQGGGIAYGTINNSLLVFNFASLGQAAYHATLNQCTVWGGEVEGIAFTFANGTSQCLVRNSIVDGYNRNFSSGNQDTYEYSCTLDSEFGTMPFGDSNINADLVDPQFLDLYHLQSTSPCRGTGNPLYSVGTDLDGEPWVNPPSMGCSEFVPASRSGPLTINFSSYATNVVVNDFNGYFVVVSDNAAALSWSYSDGTTITNVGNVTPHTWTNAGNQSVTVTAYNESYPNGVSATLPVNVFPSPITNFPAFVTAYVDGNVTFDTITPIPRWDPPYSLQWYFNGIALTNDSHYAGTQSGALTISNVQPSDAGNYYMTASNYNVSGSNLVDVLSVTAAIIAPGFLSQPQSQTNFVGSNVLFSVTPSGTQPIQYQWQFDGTNISGATNASLELTNLSYANAGTYTLVLSNSAGTNVSQPATLTVVTSPPVVVNLTPRAGTISLQWPSSGGTNLLATPDLTQPWAPAGLPIISSNFMNSVAVPIGTTSQFFRLLQ